MNKIYSRYAHKYIISSERSYYRYDESGCPLCSDSDYKVGDTLVREDLLWVVDEVIE